MNAAEAGKVLSKAKLASDGDAFFVYKDLASALGAKAVKDMPNKMFAESDKIINGEPVYILKRDGFEVHHGYVDNMHMWIDKDGNRCNKHILKLKGE